MVKGGVRKLIEKWLVEVNIIMTARSRPCKICSSSLETNKISNKSIINYILKTYKNVKIKSKINHLSLKKYKIDHHNASKTMVSW